jgi:hypothetical protein
MGSKASFDFKDVAFIIKTLLLLALEIEFCNTSRLAWGKVLPLGKNTPFDKFWNIVCSVSQDGRNRFTTQLDFLIKAS